MLKDSGERRNLKPAQSEILQRVKVDDLLPLWLLQY